MAVPARASAHAAVTRDGRRFSVERAEPGASAAAPLPPLCVKCGAPSAGRLAKTFYWHASWVYVFILLGLVPYALLAMVLRKRLDLEIPLCADHRRGRRNTILAAWLVMLGGIGLPFALGAAGIDSVLLVVLPFVAMLVALFVGFGLARPVVPTEIHDFGGTFRGAGEGFLSKLP